MNPKKKKLTLSKFYLLSKENPLLNNSPNFPVLLLLLLCCFFSYSQVRKDTTALSEIVIASPIATTLQKTAAAVAVIRTKDLERNDGVILTSVLNAVPGIYMQQGALNTNRITIRGIGSRTQYGTNKVKAYFEGIPLTTAEGETSIEDIDLETISRIEIIKGSNSTSFGSGLGGVIQLFSKDISRNESFAKSKTTFGSYGLLQQSFSGGYGTEKSTFSSNYSHLHSDGFRANSVYDRKAFTLHGKQSISSNGSLSFIGNYTRLKALISSSLNENDFLNQPEKAADNWAAAQGYESYDKVLLGLGYQNQLSEKWSFKTNVFSNFKDAYEPRPFDIIDDKTTSFGLRSTLNFRSKIYSIPFEASLGTEMATERYAFSLFENKYQSQPNQGSIEGAEFSSKKQNRNYRNYFLQMDFELTQNLHLETGVALNATQYSHEDTFETNTTIEKAAYTFGNVWSPRLGISYAVAASKNIYASVSKGFSVPSVAETLTPEGEINTNLKPELGWNYELGFKGNWLQKRLYTEMAFFSTQIANLLVARRTAEDQFVGINAGESSHLGVELALNYQLVHTDRFQLTPYFSCTFNDFKFKDFVDGDNDYSGNALTGIPNKQWNVGVDAKTATGFTANASYLNVGMIPMNDSGTKYSEAYGLVNVKFGYSLTILKFLKTEFSSGINNVGNTKYAASFLPNAVGFGKALPRYYYPGNPRNYYLGFSVSYIFI